ncbi:LysE family transporter [Candidatus Sordicultor fermentans]|jgi:threonine/homoserine/homoserine lactone efflux protein|uniref:LysE family transporter n=1 Tax=Candidatus Sordicultor fermentans TaxID=1953203 RepID=UPI0016B9D88C|nr:LysE family transporter [Candidatus Atribacteria bacterium]
MNESWELLSIFGSAFLIGFSGALMPGPLLALVLSGTYQVGYKAGPLVVLGHGILELGLVIVLMLGLGKALDIPLVHQVIGIGGGVVLLYLGIDMLRMVRNSETFSVENSSNSEGGLAFKGLLVSLSNPYWIMWWATVGLALLLSATSFPFWGVVFFFLGHILSDFVWYSAVSFTLHRGKNFLSPRFYQWLVGICGGFMLFFGIYFISEVIR